MICTIKSSFLEAKPLIDHLHLACYKCEAVIEYTTPTFERLKPGNSAAVPNWGDSLGGRRGAKPLFLGEEYSKFLFGLLESFSPFAA